MKTLADEAEEWAKENAREIPPRNTPEWLEMYHAWVAFAFDRLRAVQKEMCKPRRRQNMANVPNLHD